VRPERPASAASSPGRPAAAAAQLLDARRMKLGAAVRRVRTRACRVDARQVDIRVDGPEDCARIMAVTARHNVDQ